MNILGTRKTYNEDTKDRYDLLAKEMVELWSKQWGYSFNTPILEQKEMYSLWDIEFQNENGDTVHIECEARKNIDFVFHRVWSSGIGEYKLKTMRDLHFPARKANSVADYFVSYSIDNDALAVCDRFDVFDAPLSFDNLSQTDDGIVDGECFFGVEWNKPMYFFREKAGSWIFSPLGRTSVFQLVPRYEEWNISENAKRFRNYYMAMMNAKKGE